MSDDLYVAVGVGRGATEKQIRSAYRKAAKAAHPDMPDGSSEKFAALTRALDVLTDPGRRQKYDATGEIEDHVPDTRDATALNLIAAMLAGVDGLLQGGGKLGATDILRDLTTALHQRVAEGRGNVAKMQKLAAGWDAAADRFGVKAEDKPNLLRNLAMGKANLARDMIRRYEADIAAATRGLEIVAEHTFRVDASAPYPSGLGTMGIGQFGLGNMW